MMTAKELIPRVLRRTEPGRREYKPRRYELFFETEGLAPCVTAAHRAVQWFINDVAHREEARRRWVTLFGRSGCGKTHLMLMAELRLREELPARSVQAWGWGDLLGKMLDGAHPGLLEQVQELPVLMLDDVGAELMESARWQSLCMRTLLEVLDARLGRWTMLSSNLAPEDMPDARVASRLFRGLNEVVDMRGADDYALARWKERRGK